MEHTNYARLAGALKVQLSCAHSVLLHLSKESPWAREEAERIGALFNEIEEGEFVQKEVDGKEITF